MSDSKLEELKTHVEGLSAQDYSKQAAKTKDNPQNIFNLISKGDAVGVYVAFKEGVARDIKDTQGQTPLHHAAGKNTSLIADVILDKPNKTPWMRDNKNRLPLDIASEAGHRKMEAKLERFTYPQLLRHSQENEAEKTKLDQYNDQRKQAGYPDTKPNYMKGFEPRSQTPTLDLNRSKDKGIDR